MNRFTLPAAAALLALAGSAFAQADPQSVEVRAGMPVRTDVQALCPDIAGDLNDTLLKTVQEVATAATIDVRFELRGRSIDAVQTGAGPLRYQRMLKRAVRGLACDGGSAAAQQVALRVRFVDPFERSNAHAGAGLVLVQDGAAR